jgi:ABC-type lipoprotein release transport system permease subunit
MYRPNNPRNLTQVDENTRWMTIVGVVREVQLVDIAGRPNSVGAYYTPAAQSVPRGLVIAIRTSTDPESVMRTVRAELNKLDPAMPVSNVRTMDEYAVRSLMSRRTAMILAITFGLVSLFLSSVGIYGVLAYVVSQRTREIGIRMALGSTARGIFHLVLREGVWLLAVGLILGFAGTRALRRVLETQIYGLDVMDPFVLAAVILTLGIIALAACSLPARRAAQVDPASVLNQTM